MWNAVTWRLEGLLQAPTRLVRMQAFSDIEVSEADIHLWQQCNPVVTEAA
jgi:hypothetical protein